MKTLSELKRFDLANERDLCKNCLRNDHKTSKCKNQLNCFKCKKRHHTMIHLDGASGNQVIGVSSQSQSLETAGNGMQVLS